LWLIPPLQVAQAGQARGRSEIRWWCTSQRRLVPVASSSSIEWTDATWNPVAGCTILSPGCTNCYAMRMAARLEAFGQEKYAGTTRKTGGRYKWTGKVVLDYGALTVPRSWRKGRRVFVNSMSDLFHEDVPLSFIQEVFHVMEATPHHTYQVLTKRADRLLELSPLLLWPMNTWMGVSVESADYLGRVDRLRRTGAKVKFVSLEPLLGPVLPGLDLTDIHWAIAGGESGPGARPMESQRVRAIRDACVKAGVAFHFKQWGGPVKGRTGRHLDGRTWDELPAVL
jgi:protein gp37